MRGGTSAVIASQTHRMPSRQTAQNPQLPRCIAVDGWVRAASHAGQRRHHSLQRPGPSLSMRHAPPPPMPAPSRRRASSLQRLSYRHSLVALCPPHGRAAFDKPTDLHCPNAPTAALARRREKVGGRQGGRLGGPRLPATRSAVTLHGTSAADRRRDADTGHPPPGPVFSRRRRCTSVRLGGGATPRPPAQPHWRPPAPPPNRTDVHRRRREKTATPPPSPPAASRLWPSPRQRQGMPAHRIILI